MAKFSAPSPAKAAATKKNKRKPKQAAKNKKVKPSLKTDNVKTEVKPKVDDNYIKLNVEKDAVVKKVEKPKVAPDVSDEQLAERYPVFKDKELFNKFRGVAMSNNQKGRVRLLLRSNLKGTADELLPDIINSRIEAVVKNSKTLTDAELRKIRVLYNMLITAIKTDKGDTEVKKVKKNKKKNKKNKNQSEKEDKVKEEGNENTDVDVKIENTDEIAQKPEANINITNKNTKKDKKKDKLKGPKRYVVFVGNLPLDVDKEKIMEHFSEFKNFIVDVRLPKQEEGKKSSIAYIELKNEPSYELALSKHHSMLANRRINVLYTTQKNSKVSKTEAKGKAAKLIALQKSGKLMGSISLNKKRSQRRMKAKLARAKLEAEAGA